ncbi:MAG: hypothetical protein GTO51_03845 [Candidatus Latescibacteria bacterium]|nr:hypothetical protein [Candidatus Latescibacterota bacterium]NIM20972.1 hypothetical protein [Candidatus Latescibacterota bacterium]NIM65107.1 hypothetical protein [Candidatus Latescibacterota bacterium]NIO01622.1 hypothetical protein [Candidatus Latescibacterota bacterium]NIO28139.1 hypothetical protein [Candidatus Latescibacterota bacterium]
MASRICRSVALSIFSVLILVLTVSSCYTILRHPRIAEADYERPSGVRCITCHTEDEMWQFHRPSTRYIYYPGWQYYYDTPWWYDSYWYHTDPVDPETVPLRWRSFRATRDKGGDSGIRPGTLRGQTGNTKLKSPDDAENKEKGSEGDKNKSKSDKRSIRPTKKKKKDG